MVKAAYRIVRVAIGVAQSLARGIFTSISPIENISFAVADRYSYSNRI